MGIHKIIHNNQKKNKIQNETLNQIETEKYPVKFMEYFKHRGFISIMLFIIIMSTALLLFAPSVVKNFTESTINYAFYPFMKWFLFVPMSFVSLSLYLSNYKKESFFAFLFAILFNPIIPIYLKSSSIWRLMDILIISFSLYTLYIYFSNKQTLNTSKKDNPLHNPKKLVKNLKNFTIDTPIKYTTHLWDFGNTEYKDFQHFINRINTYWKEENIGNSLLNLSPTLHKKIYNFMLNQEQNQNWCSTTNISFGWASLEGLDKWCDNGKDPFDFKLQQPIEIKDKTISTFGEVIWLFKREIEIRNENNMLEAIFLEQKRKLGRKFKVELVKLKGRSFYTDVELFKQALNRIFDEIKKREDQNRIEVRVEEDESEAIVIKIIQFDSQTGREPKEMLKEVEDGDFKMLKESLTNLCDWSIESSYENKHYRINYLKDLDIKEIEILNEAPKGFTHILRFYK